MTRGTLYLINEKYILETVEFNGDMYKSGHGQNVVDMLNEVKNVAQFKKGVAKFNKENHNYSIDLFYPQKRSIFMNGDDTIEMTSDNYYQLFFSDWTFWKNISSKAVKILTRDEKIINLEPNEVVAINFGYEEEHYKK